MFKNIPSANSSLENDVELELCVRHEKKRIRFITLLYMKKLKDHKQPSSPYGSDSKSGL